MEKTEEELYEEALRAICSLCILEGRCVYGELDPIEEEDDEYYEKYYEDYEDYEGEY